MTSFSGPFLSKDKETTVWSWSEVDEPLRRFVNFQKDDPRLPRCSATDANVPEIIYFGEY